NGPRRYAFAEITRSRQTATIGPWQVSGEAPQGWLMELLEDGYTDRSPKIERPPVGTLSRVALQDLIQQDPSVAAELRDSFGIHGQLRELIDNHLQKDACDPIAIYMALESVLRGIVRDMGSKSVGEFARLLRDHPDKFPMFSTVRDQVPSAQHVC